MKIGFLATASKDDDEKIEFILQEDIKILSSELSHFNLTHQLLDGFSEWITK